MKNKNLILFGAVALGGYLLYKYSKGTFKGTSTSETDYIGTNLDTSGYFAQGSNESVTALPFNQEPAQPQSISSSDFTSPMPLMK